MEHIADLSKSLAATPNAHSSVINSSEYICSSINLASHRFQAMSHRHFYSGKEKELQGSGF